MNVTVEEDFAFRYSMQANAAKASNRDRETDKMSLEET